jgi:hypothetical protein
VSNLARSLAFTAIFAACGGTNNGAMRVVGNQPNRAAPRPDNCVANPCGPVTTCPLVEDVEGGTTNPSPDDGAISGSVVNRRDDWQGIRRTALQYVTVIATAATWTGIGTAYTDNNGQYRITGLPAGSITLTMSFDGDEHQQVVQVKAKQVTVIDHEFYLGWE